MVFGLFGNKQKQPAQPVNPFAPQKPKGLFGGKRIDALYGLGAALRDAGNMGLDVQSDHMGAFMRQQEEFAKQKQQAQLQQQATQGMTPQQQAAYMLAPQQGAAAQIQNAIPNQLQVAAGQRANQQLQMQQQGQQFNQNRTTQQDAANAQQQQLDNQFRTQGRDIQQDQFGQNMQFRQDQAGVSQEQFAQQQALRQQQMAQAQGNADRSFGLQEQKMAAALNPALSVSDQIALQKEQRAQTEFGQEQEAAAEAKKQAELQRVDVLNNITRLREGGDLSGGFGAAFGKSRANLLSLTPGSQRRDAGGVIDQIVSNLTLDKIANFKGAISDKDLEIAQGAATRLKNPNISDREAKKALDELYVAFGGKPEAQGALNQDEMNELQQLRREMGL